MEDKIDSLSHYMEGRWGPPTVVKVSKGPIPQRERRLSDAFVTLKDSIIGNTLHKTGEAFNFPDETANKMPKSKEI